MLIRDYGAENPGEFFAVVTEVFFSKPVELLAEKPDLYGVLSDFYRQHPAARFIDPGGVRRRLSFSSFSMERNGRIATTSFH